MKTWYSGALLLALLLAACQQKPAETDHSPASVKMPVDAVPTLAQRFSPIISGYWVSDDYLKEVARTRSPLAASAHFPDGPVTILIPPTPVNADSMKANLVYNLHEGGEMTLLLKKGRTAESLPVHTLPEETDKVAVELTYRLSSTDTLLYYVKYAPKSQRVLSRIAYKRIASATAEKANEDKQASELYYTPNQLLAASSYMGTDSLGRRLKVELLPTGQVIGLPFRTYHILEDFLGGPNGVDELIFDMYQTNSPSLAANYGPDTLRLYTIREVLDIAPGPQDSTLVLKRGRLVYQLLRTKKP